MRGAATVLLAGTGLAAVTGALGFYGIRDWDGESGGHWFALFGITFILALVCTGSWVLAAALHWALCTSFVGVIWWAVRQTQAATRRAPFPEPQADEPWVPPPTDEIARVVRGGGGASPPRG
jgi:amino acid transporter